ncbi:MAG: HAMP domain-containing sensor histidine kinase [Pseudomonadota bacterium]
MIITSENAADGIELRFKDNGPGLTEENLGHIFDPFYTTKEPGRGTGLGLSVSYRIVEGMGGTISAESTPGEGTTLILTLPLHGPEKRGENRVR